jgi:hypothetical protein
VEGISPWLFVAVFALYGLMALSVVPALAAVALLLTDRPRQARRLFAAALLCEAVVWAAFCFLLGWFSLPVGLTGLSLLLAGSGQFVGALRSPRTYAVTLGLAAGAVLVIAAGTPIGYRVLDRLNLPPEWLNRLPDWQSLPVAVTSLALAGASLMIAVLAPFSSRPPEAERTEGNGLGRTNA